MYLIICMSIVSQYPYLFLYRMYRPSHLLVWGLNWTAPLLAPGVRLMLCSSLERDIVYVCIFTVLILCIHTLYMYVEYARRRTGLRLLKITFEQGSMWTEFACVVVLLCYVCHFPASRPFVSSYYLLVSIFFFTRRRTGLRLLLTTVLCMSLPS